MENNEMINSFNDVVKKVSSLLDTNIKWQKKWSDYINLMINNNKVITASGKFNLPHTLQRYSSITLLKYSLKKENDVTIDIRCKGKSVANVMVSQNGERKIGFKKQYTKFNFYNECKFKPNGFISRYDCLEPRYEWRSKEADEFRRLFNRYGSFPTKNREAQFENLLLQLMNNESANGKHLNGIKIMPITIAGCFFQMPTAISASDQYKIRVGSGNKGGGGIDILARMEIHSERRLTIFELKDHNLEHGEKPDVVIKQALAYATFIVKLIKFKGDSVWKAFGYNGGHSTIINVCCLLPNKLDNGKEAEIPDFATKQIELDGYTLELHYTYFDIDKDGNVSIARSSLIK